MRVYIYKAALLCADCTETVLTSPAVERFCNSEDSDKFPQGPFPNGGGEADTPQHCDRCNLFLENPLTAAGMDYVHEKYGDTSCDDLAAQGLSCAVWEWAEFYQVRPGQANYRESVA